MKIIPNDNNTISMEYKLGIDERNSSTTMMIIIIKMNYSFQMMI